MHSHRSRLLLFGILFLATSVFVGWLDTRLSVPRPVSKRVIRVVSMAPHVTEIIQALGMESCLIGVSDYCSLPPAHELPRCGGLLDPNFEKILSLKPDIVFVSGQMDRVQQFCRDHGIIPYSSHVDGFNPLVKDIQSISRLLGVSERGENLHQKLSFQLEKVQRAATSHPRYRSLVLISRETGSLRKMMTVSRSSFIGEMLEAAHGENIFSDNPQPYFSPSREAILAAQPEVIFELRSRIASTQQNLEKDWERETRIPAVRNGRIVIIYHDFMTTPGPRMVEIAELFQQHFMKFAHP